MLGFISGSPGLLLFEPIGCLRNVLSLGFCEVPTLDAWPFTSNAVADIS